MMGRTGALVTGIAAAGVLALATGSAVASAGTAAGHRGSATDSGVVHLYEVGGVSNTDTDVFTGLFIDHGVDHVNALDHGNVNKIVLTRGTFEANIATLLARVKVVSSTSGGCSVVLNSTAPVQISDGTGAYQGIHGSITVTLVNAMVFAKKDGQCPANPSTATPIGEVVSAIGSGQVSL
jgi:hypothetical protein